MITKKDTNLQDAIDLAYSAGIIDGEGCIGIYHNKHNGNYQLRIAVEMTKREAMDLLYSLFGGKWYFKKAKKPRNARFVWMVFNSEAENALYLLRKYLLIKKDHVKFALSCDWSSFKGGKILAPKDIEKREYAYKKIKELNKRGYFEK